MQGALSGVRVLDFTEYVAGPYCGQTLADMGADVTKIEPPLGDFWRLTNSIANNESRGFIGVNRGKRSVVVDLKTEEGRAIVHKAVADADVVITSYRGGVAQRLGMDYETLSKINPRLIQAEISAFGTSGPYSHKAGFDLVAQAMSGIIAFESIDTPGHPRSITVAAVTDFLTGTFMAYSIASALYQREQTGKGQLLEGSLFASGLAFQYRPLLSIEIMDEEDRKGLLAHLDKARQEGRFTEDAQREWRENHPITVKQSSGSTNPYYNIYRTRDSYMVVACLNNRLRREAARVLGVDDPRVVPNEFDAGLLGSEHVDKIVNEIEERFASRSTEEWCADLDAAGVPCAPVRIGEEIYDDPHVAEQNLLLTLPHAMFGDVKMPNFPIKMSGAETGAKVASPTLGQHTVEFLTELGYEEQQIDKLRQSGVVRVWE